MNKMIFKAITVLLLLFVFFAAFNTNVTEAKKTKKKYKTITTHRIKTIRQNIPHSYIDKDGKIQTEVLNEKVGCGLDECTVHKEDYISKGLSEGKDIDSVIDCKSGSNLYMIKVAVNEVAEGNKIVQKYKTLKELGFYSLQGSCIQGNNLYIAFSNKGKGDNNKKIINDIKEATSLSAVNLTAIVQLKISNNYKVANYYFVKGIEQIDDAIKFLGHANDMTFNKKKLQTTWYEVKGGGKRYTIGYIDVSAEPKGFAINIGKGKSYKHKGMFGITKYKDNDNCFAIGIRDYKSKDKRYVDYYKYKNRPTNKKIKYQYTRVKRLFKVEDEKPFAVCQCMTSTKNNIYINRFNDSPKGDNNIIQTYSYDKKKKKFKYKKKKTVLVKDPKIIRANGKKVKAKNKKWEIEGFGKLKGKGKKFYCIIVMPNADKGGWLTSKQAYLTTIKIK